MGQMPYFSKRTAGAFLGNLHPWRSAVRIHQAQQKGPVQIFVGWSGSPRVCKKGMKPHDLQAATQTKSQHSHERRCHFTVTVQPHLCATRDDCYRRGPDTQDRFTASGISGTCFPGVRDPSRVQPDSLPSDQTSTSSFHSCTVWPVEEKAMPSRWTVLFFSRRNLSA